jgi:NADPH-dependent ferric siderophore reductase
MREAAEMASAKGKITRWLGGSFLRRASVAGAADVGGFRRLVLRGEVPPPAAGTKLQVLLPSDDMRTYSPIATPEGIVLLGWTHAGGPGARWMAEVQVGSEVRFVGPQRSLELAAGPVVIAGDETSVAVAASFAAERPGQVQVVLHAGSVDDVRAAAESVGVRAAVFARGALQPVVDAVVAAHAAAPAATVALTGGSELIVALRAALRERGVGAVKAKTYWVPGRRGLD